MPTASDQNLINDRSERIVLSRAAAFGLGRVEVRPAMREVIGTESRQVLQPRVMQVLVALHRAGGVVSRDDLTTACWDGLVVGEDSINRVISQLRKTAETVGEGSFGIETIKGVGYRLVHGDMPADPVIAAMPETPLASRPIGRRSLLVAGGALAVATAIGGGAMWFTRPSVPPGPTQLSASLLAQAVTAFRQGTREGQNQAIGLLRRAVAEQPDFADGWGMLSIAYAEASHSRSSAEVDAIRQRATEAADRAEAVEPGNAIAIVARAYALPSRGSWLNIERAVRAALNQHPHNDVLLCVLWHVLGRVGRNRESVPLLQEVAQRGDVTPGRYFSQIMALWAAGRLDEADRLLNEAHQLYPTQSGLWFAQAYIQMYSGRAAATIDMLRDVHNRPTGVPSDEFNYILIVAQALISRAPSDVDAAIQVWSERARQGAGFAENAIQFASALGRVDEAFAILDAYYFNRGFAVPEVSFTVEQGAYTRLEERKTFFLFYPSMAPVRTDPRFRRLVEEIGLTAYWRDSGSRPDVTF